MLDICETLSSIPSTTGQAGRHTETKRDRQTDRQAIGQIQKEMERDRHRHRETE